ncbi:uncharacterized protein LOC126823997 [Patella vulgata]|uniref:uncharacterized protein LOC126823997 n=1 Tax=Patella vulgata TaxID=6465 RepID=UPI0024A81B26|nr:uncharacterized protein LOC126823997 [Patella vulgata]
MMYKVLLVYVGVVLCMTDTMGQSPCTNSTQGVCCLCLEGCNSTCPGRMVKVNYPSTFCTQTFFTSTSVPDAESSSGSFSGTGSSTTTATITESDFTFSTTESGDNEDLFACVPECPKGYYVNTTGWCEQCGQLCATCAGEKDKCTSCNGGLDLSNSTCDVTTTDMVTDNTTAADNGNLPIGAIVGAAVGGFAFLVLVIVGIVCCCLVRKRQMKKKENHYKPEAIENQIDQNRDLEMSAVQSVTVEADEDDYVNMPRPDKKLSQKIHMGHDKVLRYTKDPSQSVTERLARKTEQSPEDPELAELPLAPPPPSAPHQSIIDEILESDDNQSANGEQDSIYINIPKTQTGHYQNVSLDDEDYVNDDVIVNFRRPTLKSKLANNDEEIYENHYVK